MVASDAVSLAVLDESKPGFFARQCFDSVVGQQRRKVMLARHRGNFTKKERAEFDGAESSRQTVASRLDPKGR